MAKIIEVECQSPGCKEKVSVIKGNPYFGILCPKHMKPRIYTLRKESCNCGGDVVEKRAGDESFYACKDCGKDFGG